MENKVSKTKGFIGRGARVLSLFDGMSCGMLAMLQSGIEVDRYVAYEIDKYAVQTSTHNFPKIEQCGNVFDADFTQYEGFDFLIGGSPCTYWSIAQTKNRETVASGMGWELFSQYVRALKEAKPKYFLYENNKSMSKAIKESISEAFGFEPILINSALVSAQNRQRLYWCGIRQENGTYRKADIKQPEDRGILLKDILETSSTTWLEKAHTIDANYFKGGNATSPKKQSGKRNMVAEPLCVAQRGRYTAGKTGTESPVSTEQHFEARTDQKTNTITTVQKDNLVAEPVVPMNYGLESVTDKDSGVIAMLDMPKGNYDLVKRVYGDNGKSPTLNSCTGGNREPKVFSDISKVAIKGKEYPVYEVKDGQITIKGKTYPIKLVDGFYIIRKLTVRECMRLQTVPEWFEFPVSNSQAYKMLGNGWTVDVISHLLDGILADACSADAVVEEEAV